MAVSTRAAIEAGLKQTWSDDDYVKQFYFKDPMYEQLKRRKPMYQMGLEVITPLWTERGGGITIVPSTGTEKLNTPGAQGVNRAKWEYKRLWGMISMDTAGIEESKESRLAVMNQADLESEGKLSDIRKQYTRMFFSDQTGLIAQCAKNEEESTTIKLLATGMGYQAIRNGWLNPRQVIDIGTKTEEGVVVADESIVSVKESETEPTLTIGKKVKTAETHFVSIANARSGETSYETNGWRNLSSPTTTLGGLKPETVPGWAGITQEEKSTPITRQKVVKLRRKGRQKGETPDWCFTSLKQIEALENESYTQVRFDLNKQNTGDGETIAVGTLSVQSHNDCPDSDLFMAVQNHIFLLGTNGGVPQWKSKGDGGILEWKQESTYLIGAVEAYAELATDRRNSILRLSELS